MLLRTPICFWAALLLSAALIGCSGGSGDGAVSPAAAPKTRPAGPIKITATIGMIADIAKEIAGEKGEVTALMGTGVDPHLYKATTGDMDKLSRAEVIFYNGLHLEGKMADVLVKMAARTKTVQVTESIPEAELREPPEFEGHADPHVWFNVKLWMRACERIRDALGEIAPADKAYFDANAAAYLKKLEELDVYAREQIATIPKEGRVLVTAHDAFGYFGHAYDIEVMGLQGISTASEYGLRDLERLTEQLVARKIKAVFVESSISPKSIEALVRGAEAKGHKVAIGGTLYSDAMGDAGTPEGTYIGMVRHNVDTIVKALR